MRETRCRRMFLTATMLWCWCWCTLAAVASPYCVQRGVGGYWCSMPPVLRSIIDSQQAVNYNLVHFTLLGPFILNALALFLPSFRQCLRCCCRDKANTKRRWARSRFSRARTEVRNRGVACELGGFSSFSSKFKI